MRVRVTYDETVERTAIVDIDDDELDEFLGYRVGEDAEREVTPESLKDFLEAGDEDDWAVIRHGDNPTIEVELRKVEVV